MYAKNGCPATTATIQYSAAGRVISFNSDSSTAITYDERGQARTMGTGRHLTYDRSGRVLTDETGDAITEYIWAGSDSIAVVSTVPPAGPVVHVVATDHLGAPWRAWDASTGNASWNVSYEPFGRVTPSDGATSYSPSPAIALRRPEQIADASASLYQNWWRYYDGASGRYLQSDPIGLRGGPNTYAYVSSNPLSRIDPYGLWDVFVFGGLTATSDSPVRAAAEGVGLVGYSSDNGAYAGVIGALGVEYGSHQNYAGGFSGWEVTTCSEPEPIDLAEVAGGPEIPFVGGIGIGGGTYSTPSDNGYFGFFQGGIFGQYGSIGIGFSGDDD